MVSIGAITQAERDTMKYPRVVSTPGGAQQDDDPDGAGHARSSPSSGTLNITGAAGPHRRPQITTTIKKQNRRRSSTRAKSKLADYPKTTRTGIVSIDPSTGGISGYYGGN